MNMAMEFEENTKSLGDYIKVFKRRQKQLYWSGGIVFVIVALLALLWPATYRSTATILIEEQDLPQEFVQSTVTTYATQQIEIIKQRVMTLKNVMGLVKKYELYSEAEMARMARTEILEEFLEDTQVSLINAQVVDPRSGRPGEATIAFSLSYSHESPTKAQKVANELTSLFLSENLKNRTAKSQGASQFLTDELEKLSAELLELENAIASFKEVNEGSLPALYQYNLSSIDRIERELLGVSLRYKELEKNKLQLESDLTQVSPYAPTTLPSGEQVLSDYDRLKALESEYRRRSASYSDEHPTVKRLKREIDVLKSQVGNLSADDRATQTRIEQDKLNELKQKYTADHPKVLTQERVVNNLASSYEDTEVGGGSKPDNPTYVLLETQLKSAESEMAMLKEKESEHRTKMAKLEEAILKMPVVEKEYAALQRDYQNAQNKYAEIKAKLMTADVAKSLEQDSKGQRFVLIGPPILPEQPVSPNRPAIIVVGFILALGVGVGIVLLGQAIDPALRGEKALTDLTGTAPMVAVPYITIAEEDNRNNKRLYYLVGGAIAAGLLALTVFHFAIKPLDVTWFIVMRKLGL